MANMMIRFVSASFVVVAFGITESPERCAESKLESDRFLVSVLLYDDGGNQMFCTMIQYRQLAFLESVCGARNLLKRFVI
mmetsp:Transcript_26667/g.62646  ORF Transcript_26667/g.62646 Transcript_26667/m.62646 type:complete len:80 (-) Transcript_26667:79-318(-)